MISKPGDLKGAAQRKATNNFKVCQTKGLIDTGATGSCVSPFIAEQLGLITLAKKICLGVNGEYETNTYKTDLSFLSYNQGASHHCFENATVSELSVSPESAFQVLIGMDILMQCVFTLSPDGHFVLST